MSAKYPLYQSHIDLSHAYWKSLVKSGDTIIDATCGNGHDTLALAELALTPNAGRLFALDLQSDALESTKQLLANKLPKPIFDRINFWQGCHSRFPEELEPRSVKLIQYNLGYLPGGDKSITTTTKTTLKSIQEAMKLIQAGGLISITCYPGHSEGKTEEEAVVELSTSFDPKIWSCCHYRWMNRNKAPSLLLIQKKILTYSNFPMASSVFRERE